ncbi:hypothetical protein V6N11_033998 [Hibiscus sabdariffa]|uniref:Uncharacterized protein n=1 Tax=Hibiscus sabdariffa TaxID=183260 RepID=A0ABR2S1W7_9ROSI
MWFHPYLMLLILLMSKDRATHVLHEDTNVLVEEAPVDAEIPIQGVADNVTAPVEEAPANSDIRVPLSLVDEFFERSIEDSASFEEVPANSDTRVPSLSQVAEFNKQSANTHPMITRRKNGISNHA